MKKILIYNYIPSEMSHKLRGNNNFQEEGYGNNSLPTDYNQNNFIQISSKKNDSGQKLGFHKEI